MDPAHGESSEIEVARPLSAGKKTSSTSLLGVRLDCVDDSFILARMRASLDGHEDALTITYAHFETLLQATRHPDLRAALHAADIVFPDGIALYWTLRLLTRAPVVRFSSPDLNAEAIAQCARLNKRILCVGGSRDVAERMPAVLQEMGFATDARTAIEGWTERADSTWKQLIDAADADMIVLGMGTRKQNLMLHPMRQWSRARVVFAVGACFDLLTGATSRPSRWVWAMGLEWTSRLRQEPRRLWKRYLLHFPLFIGLVLREQLRAR